ncbi:MAG: hypothetical protein QF733_08725 [Phycisphaerales bacterium]|nr:hypothetical protein [Phycisphaerales bacterium]
MMLVISAGLGAAIVALAGPVARCGAVGGRPARQVLCLWLPLAVVLPFLGLSIPEAAEALGGGAAGPLLSGSGAPLAAAAGLAVAYLLDLGRGHRSWHLDDHLPMSWPALGGLMLVLAAAGSVPQFVAGVAMAAGLVLVWLETMPRVGESHADRGSGGGLVAGMLVAAAALGWTVAGAGGGAASLVCTATGVGVVLRVAGAAGGRAATLTAGWAASLGPALSLGVLAMGGVQIVVQDAEGPLPFVGYRRLSGLEGCALAGVTVLCLCGLVVGWTRWARPTRVVVAVGVLVAAVAVIAGLLDGQLAV